MANTYFCFSDECGDYKPLMNNSQIKSHPFYVRTTLLINSTEWKFLNSEFQNLRKKHKIPHGIELKWASLWRLKCFQEKGEPVPNEDALKPLEKLSYYDLVNFVYEALFLINKLNEKKVIATFTDNRNKFGVNEDSILAFHLQEHIRRIEMELRVNKENLGVLFFDSISRKKNELLQRIYNQLFKNGDFLCLTDCLSFINSHQSVGIQISDYISGVFNSVLKSYLYKNYSYHSNYSDAINMFFDNIYSNLRRESYGSIRSYRITELPKSLEFRNRLMRQLKVLENSRIIAKSA